MAHDEKPYSAPERDMAIAYLDACREGVITKLEGLSEGQAREKKPRPAANHLVGIVNHLGWVEAWWFRHVFAGEAVDFPWSDENPNADFNPPESMMGVDAVAFYRSESARSNEIIRAAPTLDDEAATETRRGHTTLRWILFHMIEETARHAGQADIIREMIDGSVSE